MYRFGDFEIDASQRCLKCAGEERHLRQKTFQVLVYLIENRERLVSKNELFDKIWTDIAVSDNALDQCLAEIRKVLGDDSRNPRYVKTIPRAGYRFIGELEVDTEDEPVTPRLEEPSPVVLLATRRAVRPLWFAAFGLLLVGMFIVYAVRSRNSQPTFASTVLKSEPGKQPVAVMFFDNQSNSKEFDWLREGLADMLITDLSRSKNLAVLSRQQLQLLLERTGYSEDRSVSLDEALNLARKSQAKIVIMGGFAQLGQQIRIDVQLHDARDGELLAAERLVVDQPTQILSQIDLLSVKLASHLGAGSMEQEESAGLVTQMTNNLEAYRNYSLGVEKAWSLHSDEALHYLQKAISLDPQFTMAYARIGYTYAVASDRVDEGKPFLEKAFQLSSRLSKKDELNITAWYAIANRDYAGAIKTFQEIVTRYPFEVEAYWRLGHLLRGEEKFDQAIEVMKQGLVMDPQYKDLYNGLGLTYMELRRESESLSMLQRYVELAPLEPNSHDSLGIGYQQAGRYDEAEKCFLKALEIKPDFEIAVIHLGNNYVQQGRNREALGQFQRYLALGSAVPAFRSRANGSIGTLSLFSGKLDQAERLAKLSLKDDKNNAQLSILVALRKGDLAAATKLIAALDELFRQGSLASRGQRIAQRFPHYYQGLLELRAGRASEAIESFKQALLHRAPYWHLDTFEDCLGNALLELRRFDEAIAEYQRILKFNPNYPLIHYHLAQAYEGKGLTEQARNSYRQFLQTWSKADSDIPEVVVARSRI